MADGFGVTACWTGGLTVEGLRLRPDEGLNDGLRVGDKTQGLII